MDKAADLLQNTIQRAELGRVVLGRVYSVDLTTKLCFVKDQLLSPKLILEMWVNMASKAMKKKESKERVASAARTMPE